MKYVIYLLTSLALVFTVSGAAADQIIEKTYDINDVREISAGSGIRLEITQGETESLRVKAGAKTFSRVHVDLSDHKLSLNLDNGLTGLFSWADSNDVVCILVLKNLNKLELFGGVEANIGKLNLATFKMKSFGGTETHFAGLQVQDLAIEISGGSSIDVGALNGDKIKIKLSGGSEFSVTENGTANFLSIDSSGGSEYSAKKLSGQVAEVRASGAAEVELSAIKTLKVNASGASSVNYFGKPEVISDVSGASELIANN